MFDIVCLVSGGGTNLAAIIKAIEEKRIKNVRIKAVISNNGDDMPWREQKMQE